LARKLVVLFAVVAAVGVVLIMRRREAPPEAVARPNILLITLDTTRADRLGCYGYGKAMTPSLDALARHGVVFEQAISSVPLTLPSHATILSGLHPPEHGLRVNGAHRLGDEVPVLQEILRHQGYATGAFIAAYVLDSDFGLDRGFDVYDDDLSNAYAQEPGEPLTVYRPGDQVADSALNWLKLREDKPFFCWVHLFDPHMPYHKHDTLNDTPFADQASYDAEVAFMDRQVGRIMAYLDEQGLSKNTLVIALGDHGEGLGEHREQEHGYMLYGTTQHVPLIVSWPGHVRAGYRVDTLMSLADLFPTLTDLLSLDAHYEGLARSVKPALFGQPIDPTMCYSETDLPYTTFNWCPLRSLTTSDFRYIRTARTELYDRRTDPTEQNNLASKHPEVVERLDAELSALEAGMDRRSPEKVELTGEGRRRLESLGYVAGNDVEVDTSKLDYEKLPDIKDMLGVAQMVTQASDFARQGRHGDAAGILRRAVKFSPDTARFHRQLGESLIHLGQTDEAVAELREAVRLEPASSRSRVKLADALIEQGKPDEAIEELREAIRLDPNHYAARANLANALLNKDDLDEAIAEARRAIELEADRHEAYTTLGMALSRKGDETAIEAFEKALEHHPHPAEAHVNLGLALAQLGRIAPAREHFAKAVELDPGNAEAHYNLGVVLFGEGKTEEAVDHFFRAVQLNPNHVEAHTNLSNGLLMMGKVEGAIFHAKEALRVDPDQIAAHYNAAIGLDYLGRYEEAIHHFQEVLRLDPTNAAVRQKLAEAQRKQQAAQATQPATAPGP
jgi:arylsulfatase A-like enzyme/Flp pilus assembly protein TadD